MVVDEPVLPSISFPSESAIEERMTLHVLDDHFPQFFHTILVGSQEHDTEPAFDTVGEVLNSHIIRGETVLQILTNISQDRSQRPWVVIVKRDRARIRFL